MTFAQGFVESAPMVADRPWLVFGVVLGLVIGLGAFAIFYFIRRMGR